MADEAGSVMAKKGRWDKDKSATENARAALPKLVANYFDAGRKLVVDSSAEGDTVHRFRLAGKRLRYTLELFQPFYGSGLNPYLDSMRKVQNILGDANDYETARRLVAKETPARSRLGKELREVLDKRLKRLMKKFRLFWKTEMDRAGNRRHWMRFLREPVQAPGKDVKTAPPPGRGSA
ncbi:MAG: CHAD domain-containing protein [Bryobacteraceae bacterium]